MFNFSLTPLVARLLRNSVATKKREGKLPPEVVVFPSSGTRVADIASLVLPPDTKGQTIRYKTGKTCRPSSSSQSSAYFGIAFEVGIIIQEDLDHPWVEMLTASLSDLVQHPFFRPGLFVHPAHTQRVKHIGQSGDAAPHVGRTHASPLQLLSPFLRQRGRSRLFVFLPSFGFSPDPFQSMPT